MVLIFLLILASLLYAIAVETEKGRDLPAPAPGECPGCEGSVEADWLLCPRCRTLLRERCPVCTHLSPVYHAFCCECGNRREVGS